MKMHSYLIGLFLFLAFQQIYSSTESDYPESDRIVSLPGQPPVSFQQFAGYIPVNEPEDRFFYYYFAEAKTDPSSKPLVLSLNGGPGCGTVGGTAFGGHGPFKANKDGTLEMRDLSWNEDANVLYVDSPAGAGFSYSTNGSLSASLSDDSIARDNLEFLRRWLDRFPVYQNSDLFVFGHSYSGHYIPDLVELMFKENFTGNLKGIMIGNPLLDFEADHSAIPLYLWSHGLISDSTLELLKTSTCNVSRWMTELLKQNLSPTCSIVNKRLYSDYKSYNGKHFSYLHVITDVCPLPRSNLSLLKSCNPEEAVLCQTGIQKIYLDRKDVREALHITLDSGWFPCNYEIFDKYSMEDIHRSMIPLLEPLIRSGIRVLLASGDQDAEIPFTSTRTLTDQMAKRLGLEQSTEYIPWFMGQQIGGWIQTYSESNLAFATVRGGSHFFPRDSLEKATALFKGFLVGKYPHK